MVVLRNKIVIAILLIFQTTTLTPCSCQLSATPHFPVYYPEVNKHFFVEFPRFSSERQTWSKNGRPLVVANCAKPDDHICTEPIYSVNPTFVNLHFKKITLNDSGKYILEVLCLNGARKVNSFEIIVQENPFVHTDCKDMTVNEGENVTCVCKTTSGYAPSVVTWTPFNSKRAQKDILILQNVSQKESGVYTCVAKINNLINKTSFRLNVFPKKTKAQIKFFKAFREIGPGYGKMLLILVCKASGVSENKYTILHQGVTVEYGSMLSVDLSKESNSGTYECLVRNIVGISDRRVLFLNSSFLMKQSLDDNKKTESELKMFLIIGACSFITGILASAIFLSCGKKCNTNKSKNNDNEFYDDVYPGIDDLSDDVELRSQYSPRYSPREPGNEETRNSAEYDEPEHGNEDESTYYNETNFGRLDQYGDQDNIYVNC